MSIEGYQPQDGWNMDAYGVAVGPHFFETLGIPLLLGRLSDRVIWRCQRA